MNRLQRLSLAVVLVGVASFALVATGLVSTSEPTYYFDASSVNGTEVPAESTESVEALSATVPADLDCDSLRGESPIELEARPNGTVPRYVQCGCETYEIQRFHVDHAVDPLVLLFVLGGPVLFVAGVAGLVLSMVYSWGREE